MLLDTDEGVVMTLIDLFDTDARGKLDISQVYLFFLLACAVESK